MNDKQEKVDTVTTTIIYVGRMGARHQYIREDTGKECYFKSKLQRNHEIGEIYPVKITGNLFSTRGTDEAVGTYPDAHQIGLWVKQDAQEARRLKAERDRKNIEKLARDAAKGIRLTYKRGNTFDRATIIRAFVAALEADK